jgi:hypothetical protein
MAKKTFVELIDDIDGSKAEESVSFSLDGIAYEIDLSNENAASLRDAIAPWAGKARRVSGRRIRGTGSKASSGPRSSDSAKIREWVRAQGREIADRGRIPAEIRQEYYEANGGSAE